MTAFPFVIALGAWPLDGTAGFFRDADVPTIKVVLETGDTRSGEANPGSTIPMTVALRDARGNARTTRDFGSGHFRRTLHVSVDGGTGDPKPAVLVVDPPSPRSIEDRKAGSAVGKVRRVDHSGTARSFDLPATQVAPRPGEARGKGGREGLAGRVVLDPTTASIESSGLPTELSEALP